MNDGVSPSDGVADVSVPEPGDSDGGGPSSDGTAGDGSETVGDSPDATTSGSTDDGSPSVVEALMHTQPDLQPEREKSNLGVGDAGAHAYIGVRKVAAKLMPSSDDPGQGVPAVLNFGFAGFHFFTGPESEDSDGDGPWDEETADDGREAVV